MPRQALNYHIVAHEVFHLFEDAVLPPDTNQWLHEGLAEWAAVRAENAIGDLEQNPDRTMDCVGSVCGDTEFDRNGYPGWMLFEYLAERFGDSTVKSVLDTSAASPALSGTQALSAVVQPLGTTLGKFFEDYTTARLTGNFTSALLAGVLPQTQGSIVVGSSSGAISPVTLAVNHLAVRYLDLAHGADTDTGPCYSASLALKVALPRRRRVDALLLREHEGRDRPAVLGLRQQRHVDRPVEHVRGQPARVRVATERDERRGATCIGRT